jgi:hypothetical protein
LQKEKLIAVGFFNNLKKAFVSDWDDSKIQCSHTRCSVKESGDGVAWMCQRCLSAFCEKHTESVKFLSLDFKKAVGYEPSSIAASSKSVGDAEEAYGRMMADLVQEVGEELGKSENPLEWGNLVEVEDGGGSVERGFVLCSDCVSRIRGKGIIRNVKDIRNIKGLGPNWGKLAMNDIVRNRLERKY